MYATRVSDRCKRAESHFVQTSPPAPLIFLATCVRQAFMANLKERSSVISMHQVQNRAMRYSPLNAMLSKGVPGFGLDMDEGIDADCSPPRPVLPLIQEAGPSMSLTPSALTPGLHHGNP